MTQIPAGWYPDPGTTPTGGQPQHRWWDGQQWTEHVQPAAAGSGTRAAATEPVNPHDTPDTAPYPSQPDAYQGSYGRHPGRSGASSPGQAPGSTPYGASYPTQYGASYPTRPGEQGDGLARTPDGQRLAGWWRRLGAYLLDGILIGAVSAAVGWSLVQRIADAYRAYFDQAVRAAQDGTAGPSQSDLLGHVAGAMAGFTAITLLVSLVYTAAFLKTRAATPGKLALGMQVRLRDQPGPLGWRTILLRWLVQNVATLLNVLPGIGTIASLFPLLDGLWPLWDGKKQALHDKAARTNVVLTRD